MQELKDQIVKDINDNNFILFMKGTKQMPMCGFSATVVNVLNSYGIDYKDVNVQYTFFIKIISFLFEPKK